MSSVLSIEIGTIVTRVVEMSGSKGKYTITKAFTFETPDDATNNGKVRVTDDIINVFRQEFLDRGIKTQDVIFSVASPKVLHTTTTIPYGNPKEVQSMLNLNIGDYFPVESMQYHPVYVVKKKIPGKPPMAEIDLFAVPHDLSESYYNLAVALDLNISKLVFSPRSNAVYFAGNESGNTIVAEINERQSSVSFVKNGEVLDFRTIQTGIDTAVRTIQASDVLGTGLTYYQCLEALMDQEILLRDIPEINAYSESPGLQLKIDVTSTLRPIIMSMGQALSEMMSNHDNVDIDNIILTGLAAEIPGISQIMTHQFEVKTDIRQRPKTIAVPKGEESKFLYNFYATQIAALEAPSNLLTPEESAGGDREKVRKINKYTVIAGVALLILFSAYSAFNIYSVNNVLKTKNGELRRLKEDIAVLQQEGVVEKYQQFKIAQSYYDQARDLYQTTSNSNEDIVTFFEELESVMVKSTVITGVRLNPTSAVVSFAATGRVGKDRIGHDVYISSDKIAADLMHRLRFDLNTTFSMYSQGFNTEGDVTKFEVTFQLKTTAEREEYQQQIAGDEYIDDEIDDVNGGETNE